MPVDEDRKCPRCGGDTHVKKDGTDDDWGSDPVRECTDCPWSVIIKGTTTY